MLLPTINTADGDTMASVDVDPDHLPRRGDFFELPKVDDRPPTVWRIDGVVWSGHPLRLEPTALRLTLDKP